MRALTSIGLAPGLIVSISTAGNATLILLGTTTDPTGINDLIVDGTTYDVTFVTEIVSHFRQSTEPVALPAPWPFAPPMTTTEADPSFRARNAPWFSYSRRAQ